MALRSHHYGGAVIFAPKSEEAYFEHYRKAFPSEDFRVYTIEETQELFAYDLVGDAVGYLESKGYYSREASNLVEYLRFMTGRQYKNAWLKEHMPLVEELLEKGYFQKKSDPAEIFCNKVLFIRGYNSGKRIAEILQDLPNISVNWDTGRATFKDEEIMRHEYPTFEKCLDAIRHYVKKHGKNAYLRYEGIKPLPDDILELKRLEGPFIPTGAKVIYLETPSRPLRQVDFLSDKALKELHLASVSELEALRRNDEDFFLRNEGVVLRVFEFGR